MKTTHYFKDYQIHQRSPSNYTLSFFNFLYTYTLEETNKRKYRCECDGNIKKQIKLI